MDRWILADCQSLLRFMDQEMAGKLQTESLFSISAWTYAIDSVPTVYSLPPPASSY
jgi:hypothetical protein